VDSHAIISALAPLVPGAAYEPGASVDFATVYVPADRLVQTGVALRETRPLRFTALVEVTAADYFPRDPRFEVVYHLYSLARNHRLRVKVRVPEEEPWVHTLVPLWKAANWLEREVWDLFGLRFIGHPDPRRILLYEEFVGHPLRKDYPVDKRHPLTPERDPIQVGWKV